MALQTGDGLVLVDAQPLAGDVAVDASLAAVERA